MDRTDTATASDLMKGYRAYTDAAELSAVTQVETPASIDPDIMHPTTTVITTSR